MAQRALSYPWTSPAPEPLGVGEGLFSISKMAPSPAESGSAIQFAFGEQQKENSMSYHLDCESISYQHSNLIDSSPSPLPFSGAQVTAPSFLFSPEEIQTPTLVSLDLSQQQHSEIPVDLPMKQHTASLETGESICNPGGIECGGEGRKGLDSD